MASRRWLSSMIAFSKPRQNCCSVFSNLVYELSKLQCIARLLFLASADTWREANHISTCYACSQKGIFNNQDTVTIVHSVTWFRRQNPLNVFTSIGSMDTSFVTGLNLMCSTGSLDTPSQLSTLWCNAKEMLSQVAALPGFIHPLMNHLRHH